MSLADRLASLSVLDHSHIGGLPGSSKSAVVAALHQKYRQPLLVVASSTKVCQQYAEEIKVFSSVAVDILPVPDGTIETAGKRLACLQRLSQKEDLIILAPLKAALAKTSQGIKRIGISSGQVIQIERISRDLVDMGYTRQAIVGEKGEFCVRGGIVDIFPANADYPVRLDLMGETLESLRTFNPLDQRSLQKIETISILPAEEKSETSLLEIIPQTTLVVIDEPLEISQAADRFLKIKKVELSSFLSPDEPPIFESAPQARDLAMLSAFPQKEKLVVTKHSVRLKGEIDLPLVPGQLAGGFICRPLDLCVFSDLELFGESPAFQPAPSPVQGGVNEYLLADLKEGDYVVHEYYGIGRYRGMQKMHVDGAEQEYVLLEYAAGDLIYVPLTMMGLVEKYSSGGDFKPRLTSLRTQEWLRAKNRVKGSIKEMTAELLEIYAAREKFSGTAYPSDDIWQDELRATFPYQETPDQAKAIQDVKRDMENPKPMDRLVCGDVGYGKTEVALRAAAKAAGAGKQTAVLVPTTLLAEQHFNNFKERFKTLPFYVEMLSRFRSKTEQKAILKRVAEGSCDVVIGTHRLLSRDVVFKDLGLVIVDEEHRFGVAHKEKLKKLRKTVDVLTLSATPIPRTLYFSLAGVRDLSTINTPPLDRSPVRTYVLEASDHVVREAILKELDRGGQVYYVYNIVEKMSGRLARLKKLIPEARIVSAHGQMNEKKLEQTMFDFLARKFDVLLCSTIIESGIDIPSVNTIIIDHANRFGLAQLYQLRGRVGRSAARAYAYLFYHRDAILTGAALDRLKAIQEFTALGSGYKLAMRDLEIRGSGNLLGAEQSGHIASVGFDMYCELLEEAVREAKGISEPTPKQVSVDIRLNAFIPNEYMPDERQRLALYRRMNLLDQQVQIDDLKKELADRYGPIPKMLLKLLEVLYLKAAAKLKGIKEIREQDHAVRIEWFNGRRKLIKNLEPGEGKIKQLFQVLSAG